MRLHTFALPLAAMAVLGLNACEGEADRAITDDLAKIDTAKPTRRAATGDTATASLTDAQGRAIGSATFSQGPTGVLIRIEADGLTPGWRGVHLHQTGRCEGPGFQSAAAHLHHGDEAVVHGLLNPEGDEAGDLPNIHVGADGRVRAELFSTTIRIAAEGPGERLLDDDGSALVIHAGPDDHMSQPIGGAGDRIACGVIAAG